MKEFLETSTEETQEAQTENEGRIFGSKTIAVPMEEWIKPLEKGEPLF